MLGEFIKLKIAALLHDPPHKPWVLGEHEEKAREIARIVFGEEISEKLQDPRVKSADKVASSFDRYLLSIIEGERYIPGLFKEEKKKLKNILEPTCEIELPAKIDEDKVNEYVQSLRDYIARTPDNIKYHVFYFLYELLWLHKGLPLGPADTRTPTHSVFDHDYATAAMINWTFSNPGEIRGLLVGLDVASTQEYIASSRKLRDSWTSSYVVSALIWFTIIELVEKLGPDVVLTPSMRLNPFYAHWLRQRLVENGSADVWRELEKLLKRSVYLTDSLYQMYQSLGIPPYAIIPGRTTLILPPLDVLSKYVSKSLSDIEDLKEYFRKRFAEGWSILWKIAEKYSCSSEGKEDDIVWKFIRKAFEYYNETFTSASFASKPPLALKCEVVIINEKVTTDEVWRLYDKKYRELSRRIALWKCRHRDPAIELNLRELTLHAFDSHTGLGFPKLSEKGFDYCTCCGKLPAIIILPSRESEEDPAEDEFGIYIYYAVERGQKPSEIVKLLKNTQDRHKALEEFIQKWWRTDERSKIIEALSKLKIVFSPGEKLCPWCFLKRVISLEPRFLDALIRGLELRKDNVDTFVNGLVRDAKERIRFPSTSDVASARLKEKLVEKPDKWVRQISLGKHIPFRLRLMLAPTPVWLFEHRLAEKTRDKARELSQYEEGNEAILYTVMSLEPEEMWFRSERRKAWNELFGQLSLLKWCWRYYAVVRADADSMSDLLEGMLTAFLSGIIDTNFYFKLKRRELTSRDELRKAREFLIRYFRNSCEGDLRKFISSCIEVKLDGEDKGILSHWISRLTSAIQKHAVQNEEQAKEDAKKRINKVYSTLGNLLEQELRLIVTPTYHVAISSALMRAALLDIAIINELDGLVIYAGGDDLLAFVPIDKVLDVVYMTRRAFSGVSLPQDLTGGFILEKGFLKLNEAYLPMLPSAGRSYCIYIAHYHYPLSVILERSAKLLDDVKDEFILTFYDKSLNKKSSKKDMLVLAYSPRGGEELTVIPLTWKRPIVDNSVDDLEDIAKLVLNIRKMLKLSDERFPNEDGEGKRAKIVSHNIFYDFTYIEKALEKVLHCIERKNFLDVILSTCRLCYNVVRKNVRSENDAKTVFRIVFLHLFFTKDDIIREVVSRGYVDLGKLYDALLQDVLGIASISKKDELSPLIVNIIKAAKLVHSGMR